MKQTLILLTALFLFHGNALADDWERTSPFRDVKVQGEQIFVDYEGVLYAVERIDGHTAEKIIDTAKDMYGSRWKKRVIEDLPEVLETTGSRSSFYVSLQLRELGTDNSKTVPRSKFTSENRKEIMRRQLD